MESHQKSATEWLQFCWDFVKPRWNSFAPFFFLACSSARIFFLSFVLHAIFFFQQAVAGNVFQNHLPPLQELNGRPQFFFVAILLVHPRKLASPFGQPSQLSTQVQLASTCDYLPVRLARALNSDFRFTFPIKFKFYRKRIKLPNAWYFNPLVAFNPGFTRFLQIE